MTPPSANRAGHILTAALDHAPEDREAFLATACGGDAGLLAEVRTLLAAHALQDIAEGDSDATIKQDPRLRQPATATTEHEGERIGRYKLLQEIGEGGFGTVWMAEQMEPVSRKVALKIIKLGMDTREVIARFEAERQAVAMMDHPNIAKVLDAGATDKGRPFFVMELVKGIPITQYCDEAGLGTKERLALFGDVCSAINHAHQKGVIHRDIKPSNVMVTLHGDKPVVKVIDFGIAKATQGKLTDKTLFTRFEQFIGTPVYMSPEQASLSGLDIDTRSDIYALGILLYELLVGKPPFDAKTLASAGYEEMRRIIREVEPPKPSSRLSTVAGEERTQLAKSRHVEPEKLHRLVEPDLDWIVMKAIEKDRTRRYETANAFAQDIARFLADEAVSARPPSAGYQFRKFARRNKTALRVAAAIAAVLVAATAVSMWQAVRATKAEALARERLVESEKARTDAQAISKFLTEMFKSSRPAEKKGGRNVKVADVLDTAVKKLETELIAQPERHARLLDTIGQTYSALGLERQSIPLQEKVRTFYLNHFGLAHSDTMEAMHKLASSYSVSGRKEEALKMREELLVLRRKVNGTEHPDTINAMSILADSYSDTGRKQEALKMREEALALSSKVNGTEHRDTLWVMNGLASSYYAAGRKEEAIKMQEEVLSLCRKVNSTEHMDIFWLMNNLASSYSAVGRKEEAIKIREEALVLCRKVNSTEHPDTLWLMSNLAGSYSVSGREEEALKMREEVLVLSRKVNGMEHPETFYLMVNLVDSYSDTGRKQEALKMQEDVLALSRKIKGTEDSFTLGAMSLLASFYSDAERKEEALKLREELMARCEEVLGQCRKVKGPEHPDTLMAMARLADSYYHAGRKDEALKLGEEKLAIYRKVKGPEHPDTLWLAKEIRNTHRRAELEDALAQIREVNGPEHPKTFAAMDTLAKFFGDTGHREEAIKLREELLPLLRKTKGSVSPGILWNLQQLSVFHQKAGRLDEALKLGDEALALARKINGQNDPFTLQMMNKLAEIHEAAGRKDEAIKMREEVLALRRKVLGPEDSATLATMRELTDSYSAAGRKDDAAKLRTELEALEAKMPVKTVEKPVAKPGDALKELASQALAHRNAGRYGEAVKAGEELLAWRRKVLGQEHVDTLSAIYNLGISLRMAGRREESIAMLEKGVELRRKVLGPEHSSTLATMRELAESYSATGRKDDAAKLRAELEALKGKK